MSMKKVLSAIMSLALLLVLTVIPVNAAIVSEADIEDMAYALNKLKILQGSNGDYMLDNYMSRAEAAAFIIRMLGRENYVKQNKDSLIPANYIDVRADDWFAPYVGYSTLMGIVAGNPDGTFAPRENVSEKAFLKMIISALGYDYGKDFDWTNVYQMAYSLGIVTEPSYSYKTQDDYNYRRRYAVEAMYRALNLNRKGTDTKMVYILVNEGVVTTDELYASGILGDDTMTLIESVVSLGPGRLEVTFNEEIGQIELDDIKIYDASQPDAELEVKAFGIGGRSIQIITEAQMPGRKYNLVISSVTDIYGNISGELKGSFTGFMPQEVESDFFRIKKVEQVTGNVINVYFTHPININSETASFYELYKDNTLVVQGSTKNLTAKRLMSSDNAVSIYLKDYSLEYGRLYTLRISGKLTSNYGVKLCEGQGETVEFVAVMNQAESFGVSSIEALTNRTVRVRFTREIDPAWATRKLNYAVYDKDNNMISITNAVITETGEYSGREVMLSLASSLDKTKQYRLEVLYIPDLYKQNVIEDKEYGFSGSYPEKTDLAIVSAISDQYNSVVLTFNKALDPDAAVITSNYSVRNLTGSSFYSTPHKAYYFEEDGRYKVKLFMTGGRFFDSKNTYVVNVNNMKDSLGNYQTGLLSAEFRGGSSTNIKPQIADAVTISKDAVKVTFSVEIAFDPVNISAANYTLEYLENDQTIVMIPVSVTYIDAKTLVLRFDELDPNRLYTLRCHTVKDYSGLYTRTADDGGNSITVRWGE